MSRNVILIAAIVVIAGYFYMKSSDKQKEMIATETNQQQAQTSSESGGEETQDEILVENLIKDGIIAKIEDEGSSPKVYVTADFYRAPKIDKKSIMEVLYKEFTANNPDVSSFTVYDAKSGDEVGTYDGSEFTRSK